MQIDLLTICISFHRCPKDPQNNSNYIYSLLSDFQWETLSEEVLYNTQDLWPRFFQEDYKRKVYLLKQVETKQV